MESAARCIDVHSHFAPPEYVAAVVDAASGNARLRDLLVRNRFLTQSSTGVTGPSAALTDLGRRLADMDEAGVDVAALAVPPPGPSLGSSRSATLVRSISSSVPEPPVSCPPLTASETVMAAPAES